MSATARRLAAENAQLLVCVFAIPVFLQSVRVLFPLRVFHPGLSWGTASVTQLVALTVGLFCAPLVSPVVVYLLGMRRALWLAFAGLALMRLGIQIAPTSNWMLVFAAAAVFSGLIAMALSTRYLRRDLVAFLVGIHVGLALDAGLNIAFSTWDYAWQQSWLAILVAMLMSGALMFSIYAATPRVIETDTPALPGRAFFALAAVLSLHAILIHNPAIVVARTGLPLPAASIIVFACSSLGILGALYALRRSSRGMLNIALVGVLAVALAAISILSGLLVVFVLLATSMVTGMLVAFVCSYPPRHTSWTRSALSATGAALLFLALSVGANYLDSGIRMPVEFWVAPPLTVLILALLSLPVGARAEYQPATFRWALVPLIGLLISIALLLKPQSVQVDSAESLRIMTYNIRQGMDVEGRVALEAQAATIELEHPDIVLLQEVSRGSLVNGNVDTVGWLAQRLGMEYHFFSADRRFGNAILSHVPIIERGGGLLPRNDETMQRVYAQVVVEVGDEPVTLISTHLDHQQRENRLPQVARLIDLWAGAARTIIGGDLNSRPDSSEILALIEAGLIDTQAATGNATLDTFIAFGLGARIDYILTAPGATLSDFSRPLSDASDHLPIVVTVRF